jgi:ubiquinol-cytochrome c reductase cytochrome b subunit
MFSNKQYDYLRFKDALLSGIINWKDIPKYTIDNKPINSIESITSAYYFPAWLVGFIEAEGCFNVYKLYQDKDNLVASFDVAQRNGDILIYAIREHLSFTNAIHIDKTNCSKLKVTGVRSIENIIKFLQNAPVQLLGNKRLQYLLWLKQLRTIPRYLEKIKIPSKY